VHVCDAHMSLCITLLSIRGAALMRNLPAATAGKEAQTAAETRRKNSVSARAARRPATPEPPVIDEKTLRINALQVAQERARALRADKLIEEEQLGAFMTTLAEHTGERNVLAALNARMVQMKNGRRSTPLCGKRRCSGDQLALKLDAVCLHTHIHVCTRTCTHTCAHLLTRTRTTRTRTHTTAHTHARAHAFVADALLQLPAHGKGLWTPFEKDMLSRLRAGSRCVLSTFT
jgi:hypothetical protein